MYTRSLLLLRILGISSASLAINANKPLNNNDVSSTSDKTKTVAAYTAIATSG